MRKQKLLLGTTSLKERYEKKLWSLILEETGAAAPAAPGEGEVTKEQVEEAIQKLVKKIKEAGIENGVEDQINNIVGDLLKKMESTDSKKYKKKFDDMITEWSKIVLTAMENTSVEEEKAKIGSAFIDLKSIGVDFFKADEAGNTDEKNKIKKEIQSLINSFVNFLKTELGAAENSEEDKRAFKELMKEQDPFLTFFKEIFEENDNMPSMEDMLSVVNTLDKKITAIVKAYGEWLKDNKDNISKIIEVLQNEESGGSAPKPQNAGYRRLGNTLFERFLMSGGLK